MKVKVTIDVERAVRESIAKHYGSKDAVAQKHEVEKFAKEAFIQHIAVIRAVQQEQETGQNV